MDRKSVRWGGGGDREEISNTKLELVLWRMELVSFHSDSLFLLLLFFLLLLLVLSLLFRAAMYHVFESMQSFIGPKSQCDDAQK